MAKTFFPIHKKIKFIDASFPHPENTQYKVSIGTEIWDGENHEVMKVQMVYNGKVSGRRSPSYPIDTDDLKNVMKAIQKLLDDNKGDCV